MVEEVGLKHYNWKSDYCQTDSSRKNWTRFLCFMKLKQQDSSLHKLICFQNAVVLFRSSTLHLCRKLFTPKSQLQHSRAMSLCKMRQINACGKKSDIEITYGRSTGKLYEINLKTADFICLSIRKRTSKSCLLSS